MMRTTEYRYDARGRLVEVRHGDGRRVQYVYDAEGNRVEVRVLEAPKRD